MSNQVWWDLVWAVMAGILFAQLVTAFSSLIVSGLFYVVLG